MAYGFYDDKSKAERKLTSSNGQLINVSGSNVCRVSFGFPNSWIFGSDEPPTDEEILEYVKEHFVGISHIKVIDGSGNIQNYPVCGYDFQPAWFAAEQLFGIRMYIYFDAYNVPTSTKAYIGLIYT